MLKKILYILFSLLPLCLMLSCSLNEDKLPFVEGKKYSFDIDVKISDLQHSAPTRAFRDQVTDFPPLWVVVFDNNGYLVESAKAGHFVREGDITHFSVELTATSSPRIVHLLLNYVDDSVESLNLEYAHESNLIGRMVVSGNRDVYWQRIELPAGVNDQSIDDSMQEIPLLRNFLKITLANYCNDFTYSGFYVVNVPEQGTVAPYQDGEFVDWKTSLTYREVLDRGYTGRIPDSVTFKNRDVSSVAWQTEPYFLYEKPFDVKSGSADNTLTVLVKGTYNNGQAKQDTYYKVDLVYSEGGINHYYHLLRNFAYNISINEVTGDGSSTPEEALKGAANNNMVSSVNLKDLLHVSDGTSSLYVSYTDTTLTTTNAVMLKFKFIPDMNNVDVVRNDLVSYTRKENAIFDTIFFNNTAVDSEGWSIMTLIPEDKIPVAEILEHIVVYTDKLSREVTYRMRPKYDMFVECIPSVVDEVEGSDLLVNVKIPNALNSALFPLDIHLTSVSRHDDGSVLPYISPNNSEHISVQMIGDTLYFVKDITYGEYLALQVEDNMRILPCRFITNTDRSASTVYASNKHFNDGSDSFRNTSDSYIKEVIFSGSEYYGVGNDIELVVTATQSGQYTISSESLGLNAQTISLTVNTAHTATYQTTTWSAPASISVAYNYDGDDVVDEYMASDERNVLKMKASYTRSIDNTLFDATVLNVYLSREDAEKGRNSLTSVVNSALKMSGAELVQSGLNADTELWFAYVSGLYVYTASTTALKLYEKTAILEFGNPIEAMPVISNPVWTAADYYGVGKTVTLTFETTIPSLDYSINSVSSNLNLVNSSVDGNTVTMTFTTITWSAPADVTITAMGTDIAQFTGPNRNKLTVKLTGSGSNLNDRTNVTMSVANSQMRWSNWKNGQVITIDNLTSDQTITFSYTSRRSTYSGSTTAGHLAEGTVNITFSRQY